jgi:nicotinamidase-related amidase
MDRLVPASSLLLVIDVQERLAAAMPAPTMERLVRSAGLLLEAAAVLGVPVLATEQYPRGLGPTVRPLAEALDRLRAPRIEKLDFDAAASPRFSSELGRLAPRAVIVVGMETHVCVFQTARELARRGLTVHVVGDAVASRTEDHRLAGLSLCERAGAIITVAEAVAFDWVERAGTDSFRAVSKLVR